jgi:hypothetical protein
MKLQKLIKKLESEGTKTPPRNKEEEIEPMEQLERVSPVGASLP